jgi:hypothetical protein
MIKYFTNPLLIDYVSILLNITPDERDQVVEYSGEEWDVDRVAIAHYQQLGPKWVAKRGDRAYCVGGFTMQTRGVWREWAMFDKEVWTDRQLWVPITRYCRRVCDDMIRLGHAHRIECLSHASRSKAHAWCGIIGFHKEATLYGAAASGADMILFARVNKAARV